MFFPRLPFLYPHLFKQALLHETSYAPVRVRHVQLQKACISTSKPLKQETYAQRYGTASEPQPPPSGSSMPAKPQDEKSLASAIEKEVKDPPKPEEQKKTSGPPPASKEPPKASPSREEDKLDSSRDDDTSTTVQSPSTRPPELNASESHPAEAADAATAAKNSENARKPKPLETIMQMRAPTAENPEEHEAPHLQARPYVHHFDTYTLVKNLQGGGFTEDQSVTIMKAVRGLLAINLDVAKEELESKSDVENETYLFRAACSELRTEILNTRKSSSTKTRTQLSHLQHTYDILSQRTSQETLALKDELRGMLNDRRMATRMQTQSRDSEISELNYKISVRLGSDTKSEVEGLRWVLTRRAAMAIGVMALLILGSLRYSSYKLHMREMQARKAQSLSGGQGTTSTGSGGGGGHTVPSREMGTQTGEGGGGIEKAENVGYVSLG